MAGGGPLSHSHGRRSPAPHEAGNRIFSGKQHPRADTQAVFFCYALPAHEVGDGDNSDNGRWSIEAGRTQWYLYDIASGDIHTELIEAIRSTPETPRRCQTEQQKQTLSDIRAKVDKHIERTYLKRVNAPQGVQPVLRAWMELN